MAPLFIQEWHICLIFLVITCYRLSKSGSFTSRFDLIPITGTVSFKLLFDLACVNLWPGVLLRAFVSPTTWFFCDMPFSSLWQLCVTLLHYGVILFIMFLVWSHCVNVCCSLSCIYILLHYNGYCNPIFAISNYYAASLSGLHLVWLIALVMVIMWYFCTMDLQSTVLTLYSHVDPTGIMKGSLKVSLFFIILPWCILSTFWLSSS